MCLARNPGWRRRMGTLLREDNIPFCHQVGELTSVRRQNLRELASVPPRRVEGVRNSSYEFF